MWGRFTVLLVAVAGGLMTGCYDQQCHEFSISKDFSPHETDMILQSIQTWNTVNVKKLTVVQGDSQCYIERVNSEEQYLTIKAEGSGHGDYSGTTFSYGVVWISPQGLLIEQAPYDQGFIHTVTHELGHAQGLNHVDYGQMSPDWQYDPGVFSPSDMVECIKQGVCDDTSLRGYN